MRVYASFLLLVTAVSVLGLRPTGLRINIGSRNLVGTPQNAITSRPTTLQAANGKRFYGISKPLHNTRSPVQQLQQYFATVVRGSLNFWGVLLAKMVMIRQQAMAVIAVPTGIAGDAYSKIVSAFEAVMKKRTEARVAAIAAAESKAKLSNMLIGMDSFREKHDDAFRAWTLKNWKERGIIANK